MLNWTALYSQPLVISELSTIFLLGVKVKETLEFPRAYQDWHEKLTSEIEKRDNDIISERY